MRKVSEPELIFTKALQDIFTSQQSIKVQTSIHLKRIDDYLFGPKPALGITEEAAELLYLGIPGEQIQGLFGVSGNKSAFGNLKKSSFYALQILFKTLTRSKNKDVFLKVFGEADEEEFKAIKLASHITEKETESALHICLIIKHKRPYLSESDYILSEESRQIFTAWSAEQDEGKKKKAKQVQIQRRDERDSKQGNFTVVHQEQTPSKQLTIESNLEQIEFYEQWVGEVDEQYYLDTFLDPVDVMEFKRNNMEERERISFRQYLSFFIETPVTQINSRIIQPQILFIHPESEKFNPARLIEYYHPDMTLEEKNNLAKIMPKGLSKKSETYVMRYFFDVVSDTERNVSLLHQLFTQNQRINKEASVGFSLRTKMKQSMEQLTDKVQPLNDLYEESEKLRKLIMFFQVNSDFARLPSTLKLFLDQDQLSQLQTVYCRYTTIMKAHAEKPVLKTIIADIEAVASAARKRQVYKMMKQIAREEVNIFISLHHDGNALKYLVPKMVVHLVEDFQGLDDKCKQQLSQLKRKLQISELKQFGEAIRLKEHTIQENQGDLLECFLDLANKNQTLAVKVTNLKNSFKLKTSRALQLMNEWQTANGSILPEFDLLVRCFILWYKNSLKEVSEIRQSGVIVQTSEQKIQSFRSIREIPILQKTPQEIIRAYLFEMCELLILLEKQAKWLSKDQLAQIGFSLKRQNFNQYCELMELKGKSRIHFEAAPTRRDIDKNPYNIILASILDVIIDNSKVVLTHPAFNRTSKEYITRFFRFVTECMTVEETNLHAVPEILTYATVINCMGESQFTRPFFNQFLDFPDMKKQITEMLKLKNKRIDQLLFSHIRIEYASTIKWHIRLPFGLKILDYLANSLVLITTYADFNYKKYSRFFMEAFTVEVAPVAKEQLKGGNKGFLTQLALIRAMSTKLTTKTIEERWNALLGGVAWTAQEASEKEAYISTTKHRYSSNYCSLFDY